ncbi:hypothetical protein TNCV_5051611 [Trichonephila clavipes]|nr:hypothetical protein TNCV_5051611 [Trichonephila clavipes]
MLTYHQPSDSRYTKLGLYSGFDSLNAADGMECIQTDFQLLDDESLMGTKVSYRQPGERTLLLYGSGRIPFSVHLLFKENDEESQAEMHFDVTKKITPPAPQGGLRPPI